MKNLRDVEKRRIDLEHRKILASRERNIKTRENYEELLKRKNEIDTDRDHKNIQNLDKEMNYLRNSVEKDMNISHLKQTVVY